MKEPTASPSPLATLIADLPMEGLTFTPVPVKRRHDGWTPERQKGFIARLALSGSVAAAADGVGKSRASAYALRELPGAESFAGAWDKAIGWGRDLHTDLAIERAIKGERRPVFHRGRQVGEYLRYDNRLTIAALRRLPPRQPAAADFDSLVAALAALAPDPG